MVEESLFGGLIALVYGGGRRVIATGVKLGLWLIGLSFWLTTPDVSARTWISASGEDSFEGRLVDFDDSTGEVTVIKKGDGRKVRFHLSALAVEDQQWLRAYHERQKAETTLPGEIIFQADFESNRWKKGFRGTGSGHLSLAKPGDADFEPIDGAALRIKIAKGDHYGSALTVKLADHLRAEPESVYFRYHIFLGAGWDTKFSGKLPGFGGTYGKAGWGGKPTDGTHGWSLRTMFSPAEGRRVPVGYYSYHADMQGKYGDSWRWNRSGWHQPGQWHLVEQQLTLNDPDKANGHLVAWVDGRQVYENKKVRLRNSDRLKIETIWLNVYYGGKTPAEKDLVLFIDNLVVASQRPLP